MSDVALTLGREIRRSLSKANIGRRSVTVLLSDPEWQQLYDDLRMSRTLTLTDRVAMARGYEGVFEIEDVVYRNRSMI